MPRPRRVCEPGVVLHVMNRANRKQRIFHGETDYSLFVEVLAAATQKFAVRLLAFCVMPNHWHLVIWPSAGDDVPAYMHWLTSTHVRQYHRVHGLIGTGHLYQGRYVSVPVQTDRHLLTVLRYVEANAVRGVGHASAGLAVAQRRRGGRRSAWVHCAEPDSATS